MSNVLRNAVVGNPLLQPWEINPVMRDLFQTDPSCPTCPFVGPPPPLATAPVMPDVAAPLPSFTGGVRKRPRPKSWRENLSNSRKGRDQGLAEL